MSESEQREQHLRFSAKLHGPQVFQRALRAASQELDKLIQQRQRIDRQIMNLQATVDSLVKLCAEDGIDLPIEYRKLANIGKAVSSPGLTDAVRAVMKERGTRMRPADIIDALKVRGVALENFSNPAVRVHTTLRRLLEAGEIARTPKGEPVRFWWVGPLSKALKLESRPRFGPNPNAIANMSDEQLAGLSGLRKKA